jgi:hypothetical protein
MLRSDLVAEAQELVTLYRQIASKTPEPQDLLTLGIGLGRALEALERPASARGALDTARIELESARVTLARIRQALER